MLHQAKLENLATEGTNITQLLEHLPESQPMATSAYWPALKALDAEVAQSLAAEPTVKTRGISLDFLQPAADSAYLGRLAHFDVMRVLGRGGMGLVLEAFDSRLQRLPRGVEGAQSGTRRRCDRPAAVLPRSSGGCVGDARERGGRAIRSTSPERRQACCTSSCSSWPANRFEQRLEAGNRSRHCGRSCGSAWKRRTWFGSRRARPRD